MNSSWTKQTISLGSGILKIQGITEIRDILNTIEDFGIDMDMLDILNPSYDELHETYIAIKCYKSSVRYLKRLKNEMAKRNNGNYI